MPGCCAYKCSNRSENGKAFFCIPKGKNDVERRRMWLHRIGRKDFVPTKNTRLCEDHFTADQFENRVPGAKRRLRFNALPSVFAHRLKQQKSPLPLGPGHSKLPTDQQEKVDLAPMATDNMPVPQHAAYPMDVEEPQCDRSSNHAVVSSSDSKRCPEDDPNGAANSQENEPVAVSTQDSMLYGDNTSADPPMLGETEVADVCHDQSSSADQLCCQPGPLDAETRDALTARIAALEKQVNLERKRRLKAVKGSMRLKASLRRILSEDQVRALERGTTKGSAWSPATILKARRLRLACGSRGYKYVRNMYKIPLPAERTLQKSIESFPQFSPNFSLVAGKNREGEPV